MKNTYIYILIDPRDDNVRYVGKSDNPSIRFNRHIRDRAHTHKTNWIKQLSELGLLPKIKIIDEVPIENWQHWERYYISYYRNIGCKLVDITEGGLGCVNTFWKGKKRSDETCLKIKNSLKGRKLSEETKEKIKNNRFPLKLSQDTFNKIGEKNSKLTKNQVLNIRDVFCNIKWGERAKFESLLSQQYHVSTRTIRGIVKNEVWKHI